MQAWAGSGLHSTGRSPMKLKNRTALDADLDLQEDQLLRWLQEPISKQLFADFSSEGELILLHAQRLDRMYVRRRLHAMLEKAGLSELTRHYR